MASLRLYIASNGDKQRDPGPASGYAETDGRRAQDPVACGTDCPRHGPGSAVLRRQEPRLLAPSVDRLERLFLPADDLRLRQFNGLDAARPYVSTDPHRLFAHAAHGVPVSAADPDEAAVDFAPILSGGDARLLGFFNH